MEATVDISALPDDAPVRVVLDEMIGCSANWVLELGSLRLIMSESQFFRLIEEIKTFQAESEQ